MADKFTRFLLLVVLHLLTFSLYAQPVKVIDSIAEKIEWYGLQKPSTTLFVHFDKNIYTNNENVWFTGYLLKSRNGDLHQTLSVALIRNDDRSILAEGKYLLTQFAAFGNLILPDSLPTGNYSFVCYTNHLVDGNPSAIFIQPVTIKTGNIAGFVANLSLADEIKPGMDTATVLLKAYTPDIKLVKGAAVTWFIGDRIKPFKTGKLKTDNYGEATIPVPLKEITARNNILHAEINNGKEIKTFSIKLPVYMKETFVKFYPEGGNSVAGTKNILGWEVINNEGDVVFANATLYQDDQPVQTLQTNAYGMGKFSFTPKPGSTYYAKLQNIEGSNDKFTLPAALSEGPVISLTNALAADTLIIEMNNQLAGSNWQVIIHNYRTVFVTAKVSSRRKSLLVKIPLTEVPAGLNTFTLIDSMGRPWAERMFFAHYDKRSTIRIATDSATYSPRQKVSLKFKVTDAKQNPLNSVVSIACAQDNRFDVKKMTDIESYNYLHAELASIPFKTRLLGNENADKEYLENLLLVRGWRKYTWPEMVKVKAEDTIRHSTSLTITGATSLDNKPVKKPVQLNMIKLKAGKIASLDVVLTDSAGNFELNPNQLFGEPNKEVQLKVNSKQRDLYSIKVNDSYNEMNKKLAGSLIFDNYSIKSFKQASESVVLKVSEGGKQMLDVTVVAKRDNSIFRAGPNVCGDYVCIFGILNCTNHLYEGFQPVVGNRYAMRFGGSTNATTYLYTGCEALKREADLEKEKQASLSGFYSAKEFYVPDYSKVDVNDPQYASTIYWNYSVLSSAGKESEVTFYTSDISGKFRLIIQGITSNNIVYGEHFFEVKK